MKQAKEKAGKLGRDDAKAEGHHHPQGARGHPAREGRRRSASSASSASEKAPGSGLSKLFAQNNDVEQAMAGMAGAKMRRRTRLGRPLDQRLGHRAAAAPATATSTAPATWTPAAAAPTARGAAPSWPSAASTRSSVGMGNGARRHRRLAVEGADQQGRPRPPRGHEVLLREGAAAQGVALRRHRHLLGDPARRNGQQGERQEHARWATPPSRAASSARSSSGNSPRRPRRPPSGAIPSSSKVDSG